MSTSTTAAGRAISFGSFRLLPAQQLLLEGETPVRLGSRALYILEALVERAGELVSKSELMARAWPDTFVEENTLRVHVSALRRALGDGQPGRRYVANVPGRGYSFVAQVDFSEAYEPPEPKSKAAEHAHNLPISQVRAVGRAEVIRALLDQLPMQRLITIVGTGGIGKTTVVLALAETLLPVYEDGVWFVDLASLSDARLVPSTFASTLGLALESENAVSRLIEQLRHKKMLVVLDNCERVVEAVASLAEQLLAGAPDIDILATSREPLRAEGERVHRLLALEVPPDPTGLTASEAIAYSSVQLFVERATASVDSFELRDADAPVIADICRKLDGIALAIEFAAARVDAFGIRQLSALLDDRFRILSQGKRTAHPRHQSLIATLDWSHEYLSEDERAVLRRLSVFAGAFTLESAVAVASDTNTNVVESVANLVAKSLLSADVGGRTVRYRLLDTTRAYAMLKLTELNELDEYVRRHAHHHLDLLERAGPEVLTRSFADWLKDYGRRVDDVRSALSWAFGLNGDLSIGLALTIAATPLWVALSLMDECREGAERALAGQAAAPMHNERDQMKLLIGFASALQLTTGPLSKTAVLWTEALELGEKLGDHEYQVRALWGLLACRLYSADFRKALALAQKLFVIAANYDDALSMVGESMIGVVLHYLGEPVTARRHIDRMLNQYSTQSRYQLFGHRVGALTARSEVLWIQGFPDQAVLSAQSAMDDAQVAGNALMAASALVLGTCPIALYVGDSAAAGRWVAMLLDLSAKHGLSSWNACGRCLKGMQLLANGDVAGLPLLRTGLDWLRAATFAIRTAGFLGALAEGLGNAGQIAEGRIMIDEALERCDRNEERWCMAELLRIKGEILRLDGSVNADGTAEDYFAKALDWARRQEALSWELRASMSLAKLWHQNGNTTEADEILSAVYNRFTEGFETADLRTARALINAFRRGSKPL